MPTLDPRRRDVVLPSTGAAPPAAVEVGLGKLAAGVHRRVPFYRQTLDFSCGPASLLMAMSAHDPTVALSQAHEIDIWREANLVEIGATSHYGLALAARRRGFHARIVGTAEGVAYQEAILSRIKVDERLMRLFHDDARRKCRAAGVPEEVRPVTLADVEGALRAGEVPIVLTDTRMFTPEEEVPHWVVVTAVVDDVVRLNNPLDDAHKADEPVALDRFLRGFGYGGDQLLVAVGARTATLTDREHALEPP